MELDEDQKTFLRENWESEPNLSVLTQRCFDNTSIDGRSKEGRAVRKFLSENGMTYATKEHTKVEDIELTDGQKSFVLTQMEESGISSVHIARMIFKDPKLTPLSKEARVVFDYMKENSPEGKVEFEDAATYSPPKAVSRVLKKINDACQTEYEEATINRQVQVYVEKLQKNLNNSRFIEIMTNLRKATDRKLFEDEFVRHTWDKPDLTAEDVSLYMNLCKEILSLEVCTKHIERLKDDFDRTEKDVHMEGAEKLTMTLAETIKTKNDEYHKIEARIESLIKKLQQDRSQRLSKARESNASILSLVRAFQEEDERNTMIKLAEIKNKATKKYIDGVKEEDMGTFIHRVLGLGEGDILP